MRNYTGLAVWGCLLGLLALEFIDFDSSPKAQSAKSDPIQSAPAAFPAAVPDIVGKAGAASVHAPFSHIREKRDGSFSYRQ
jgi:small neutral amino acid transporter SnatA (MarC family)